MVASSEGASVESTRPRKREPRQTVDQPLKSCFVVAPISRDGSDIRKRSDQILRHIIDPVVAHHGYAKALRADRISEAGRITQQVIQHITDDDLVIADLTGSNPNVYYELALRHALGRPFVQLLAGDDELPFDIADQRTIMVDHKDLDSVEAAKEELGRQISARHAHEGPIETPLSFSVDLATLRSSGNPVDKTNAEILDMLQNLTEQTRLQQRASARGAAPIEDIMALRRFVETVTTNGDVTDQDIDQLIRSDTSRTHDRWVDGISSNRNPFMAVDRQPRPPAKLTTEWSDEPPF